MVQTEGPAATAVDVSEAALKATLRVQPSAEANCVITRAGGRVDSVSQNLVCGFDADEPCNCRAEMEVKSEDGSEHTLVSNSTSGHCLCPALSAVDCVWEIDGFQHGEVLFSVTVPNRETLREVVETLRDREATVRLQQLRTADGTSEDHTVELDVSGITDKQREALRTARQLGYYDQPRTATLDDVAAALDISRSAVSQRINAVEDRLIGEFLRIDETITPADD